MQSVITRIGRLDNNEKAIILSLLQECNVEFTKNANGYFFDLTTVSPQDLEKCTRCLENIESNRHQVYYINKKRDELVVYYKKIINEKIQQTRLAKIGEYISKITVNPIKGNVTMEVSRKRLRNQLEADVDPDDLIREHTKKLNKFSKDSIFYKLEMKMRAQRHKRRNAANTAYNDNSEYDYAKSESGETYSDVDVVADTLSIDGDNEEYVADAETHIDVDVDVDAEVDDVDAEIDVDAEVDVDAEGDVDAEVDVDAEDGTEGGTDDSSNESDIETQKEMEYYKKLLLQQGYTFDDNKYCYLVYQDYIRL
ncbi:hypothetical protein EBZ38_02055 [bacterium]|nr:hypothetical protein [bacterium]